MNYFDFDFDLDLEDLEVDFLGEDLFVELPFFDLLLLLVDAADFDFALDQEEDVEEVL